MPHKEQFSVGRSTPKINLRLPDGLREKIIELSEKNLRSVNSEIVTLLQKSVDQGDVLQLMQTQLGLIRFLATCVEELADLMTDEQRADQRVQFMLSLSTSMTATADDPTRQA